MSHFRNIPPVGRKIYERTFMNEIILFFTFSLRTDFDDICEEIESLLTNLHCTLSLKEKDKLIYKDKEAIVTFTTTGVLVSIPSKEYKDFERTAQIWNNLETILKEIRVIPLVWSFSKGNRFLFNKAITEDMYQEVYSLVLSEELIHAADENHVYVEESEDRTCIFTSRFGIDKFQEKDSLSLKTMIASQSYNLNNLKEQIMQRNEDMFACWHWCMSKNTLKLMEGDNRKDI